jgi:hypothetical protein
VALGQQGSTVTVAITTPPRTESPPGHEGTGAEAEPAVGSFLRWGLLSYLVTVAVVVAAIVWWLDGHLAYVLDDPAIHLSIADRLAHDGTWGVVAGEFQSASSSPLWTVLVAAGLLVAGPAAEWVPLMLNVAAGVLAVWVLAQGQTVVEPSRRRPADAAATIVLVTVVLFLPGLAVVGMEHTLHVALVLAAVLGVHRWALDRPGARPAVTYAVIALAALTRFETAFLAVGLAVALLAVERRAQLRRAAGVLAAAAVPIAAFGALNRALGGGWLPNSILAKGHGTGQSESDGLGPVDIVRRMTQDPALGLLFGLAVGYLIVRGPRARAGVPAVALAVAAPLHAALADVGWYERYQAYLVAVGVYLLLAVLAEVPAANRRRAVAAVCVLGLLFGLTKANLLVQAPLAADDMHRQQYQAGRFLDLYYDGEPVATDQLGYISYLHHGPITDFAGLGDYAVLQAPDLPFNEQWPQLAAERGFRVVVLYDKAAAFNVPRGWVRAGEWRIDGEPLTGVSRTLQFFATVPDEVEPLQDHLRDFEDELPDRTHLRINEGAGLQAMMLAIETDEAAAADG